MRGFIISYPRGREQAALHDSLALLGEYADRLYGAAPTSAGSRACGSDDEATDSPNAPEHASDGEEDIVAALERESKALRSERQQQQRFTPIDSGVNQLLFIGTALDSPTHLVETMLEDVAEKKASPQASRNVLRVLPVQLTCKADHDKMEAAVEQVAKTFFGLRQPDGVFSYSIMYKSRNNSSGAMHRDVIIPKVADVLHRCYPTCKVDLTNPDFFLFVEVLKTVCCISIVTKYFQYKKFNLQELCAASLGITCDSNCGAVNRDGDEDGSSATIATAAALASDGSNVTPVPKESS